MEKFNKDIIPLNYPVCYNHACPQLAACLHFQLGKILPSSIISWSAVNPNALPANLAETGHCPFYRSSEKVRYAKGFIRMLDEQPYKTRRAVIVRLTAIFNGRNYYRVRKGERLLSPSEQNKVLEVFRQCGATNSLVFDDYVEDYLW